MGIVPTVKVENGKGGFLVLNEVDYKAGAYVKYDPNKKVTTKRQPKIEVKAEVKSSPKIESKTSTPAKPVVAKKDK